MHDLVETRCKAGEKANSKQVNDNTNFASLSAKFASLMSASIHQVVIAASAVMLILQVYSNAKATSLTCFALRVIWS